MTKFRLFDSRKAGCLEQAPGADPRASGATFSESDRSVLARCWHPVAESTEITTDRPFAATILDERIVLFRTAGGIVAAADVCPHRGSALSLGTVEDGVLACPYHGHRFDGSGRCVRVPANPDQRIPSKLALRRFESAERHGLVWVCLESPAALPLPELPSYGRPGFQVVHIPAFDWRCSAGRQIEAIADVAHFAFVHPVSFATLDPTVGPFSVDVTDEGVIRADFTSRVANTMDRSATKDDWRRVYDLTLPFTIQVDITFPGQGNFVIFNACCPVSAGVTRVFPIVCRDFGFEQPVSEVIDFQMRVYREDQRIVESQVPVELPLDPAAEVHVKADLLSVTYRRELRRLGLGARLPPGDEAATVRPSASDRAAPMNRTKTGPRGPEVAMKNQIMESALLDECIEAAGPAWRRYENHPFFDALEKGTLPIESFVSFQVNDAPFLPFIHQSLTLALSKAPTGSDFSRAVAKLLHEVFVANELQAKAEILASLGVEKVRFDRWALTPRREAFANHMLRVALEGTAAQAAAAIAPCTLFTHTVGRRFANVEIKGPPAFKRWAQIYVDKQMHNLAEAYVRLMEVEAKISAFHHDELIRLFVRTTQHQVAVFDDVLDPVPWTEVSHPELRAKG